MSQTTHLQSTGTRPDPSTGSDRTLSPDSLTEHIYEPAIEREETFLSPRECDCPPWVIRCAHREGKEPVLVLADADTLYALHPPSPNDWRDGGYLFGVYFISNKVKLPCNCGCDSAYAAGMNLPRTRHRSEAEALEAFFAAERELLSRGEA